MKYTLYLCLFVVLFASCKKVTNYGISDGMKEYFAYKAGSYWIYENDTTGLIDSSSVSSYTHVYDNTDLSGIKRELISMIFKSKFLSMTFISYISCGGPNYYTVSSLLYPVSGEIQADGAVAYYPNWPSNKKIIPDCSPGATFFYKTIPTDTIDNIPYQNVIYSEFRSTDSSSTNPYLYIRKIYFAKHIGIIKYYELYPYYNVNRSYKLLRYKVVQE